MSAKDPQGTCRYHCVKCFKHFKSLSAYDEHISSVGRHEDPGDCARLRVQRFGTCRLQEHDVDIILDDVPLWEYYYVSEDEKPRYKQEEDLD